MARKRPEFSFPELEHRGRNAILRSSAEVAAEEALLAEGTPNADPSTPSATPPDEATPASPPAPEPRPTRRPPRRATPEATSEPGQVGDARASVRARTRAPRSASAGQVVDRLRQKLQARQHLSSYTFRFRAEELEQLDHLVAELNRDRTVKLSKNDLIRVALGWLLTDYDEYGSESLVVEVTRQE
jgi:hypothetical protein